MILNVESRLEGEKTANERRWPRRRAKTAGSSPSHRGSSDFRPYIRLSTCKWRRRNGRSRAPNRPESGAKIRVFQEGHAGAKFGGVSRRDAGSGRASQGGGVTAVALGERMKAFWGPRVPRREREGSRKSASQRRGSKSSKKQFRHVSIGPFFLCHSHGWRLFFAPLVAVCRANDPKMLLTPPASDARGLRSNSGSFARQMTTGGAKSSRQQSTPRVRHRKKGPI